MTLPRWKLKLAPRAATLPPPSPTLTSLGLSQTSFTVGTPANGTVTGATAGSTITAPLGLPTGFTINSSARTWAYDGTGSATSGTITLVETLAGAINSPKQSVVAFSYSVPGTALRLVADTTRLSAPALTYRNAHKAEVASREWAGIPNGATFVSDVAVTTPAQLQSAISAAHALNPNAYHRIRIQNNSIWTDHTTGFVSFPNVVFGTSGGVLIEYDTGHNPVMLGQWYPEAGRVEVRGITFARAANTGADGQICTGNYGGAQAKRTIAKFKNCNFGAYWHPTLSAPSNYSSWSRAFFCLFFIQLIVEDCTFRRCNYQLYCCGGQILVSRGNDFADVTQVCHFINCQIGGDTAATYKNLPAPYNYNDMYTLIENCTHRGTLDNPAIGTPHIDFVQIGRTTNDLAVPQASKSNPGDLKLLVENCILSTDVSFSATEGSTTGVIPSINVIIDSDATSSDPNPRPNTVLMVWNVILVGTGFFAQVSNGTTNYLECSSATSAPQVPPTWNAGSLRVSSGNVYFYVTATGGSTSLNRMIIRNIDFVTSAPPTNGAFVNDNAANSGSDQPQDFFEGTFTQDPANLMWIFSLANSTTISQQAFASALIAQFTPKASVTGGAKFL